MAKGDGDNMIVKYVLTGLLAVTGAVSAQARSCMVVGEKTARVQTREGEKSPLFHTQSCESLRLISGKAMVSWVSRDGKAHFTPIGPNGVEQMPSAGADERPGNAVWAELTSVREATRPAFMRAIGEERPARVFVPASGLDLPDQPGSELRILAVKGNAETLVLRRNAGDPRPIHLTRDQIQPGVTYHLEWHKGGAVEQWKWVAISADEAQHVEARLKEIEASVVESDQRRVVIAMLFEQLRLRLNRHLALDENF